MANYSGSRQYKPVEETRKHTTSQLESKSLSSSLDAKKPEIALFRETPFQPSLEQHTELLSSSHSDQGRSDLLLKLQRSYGNNYVQRLLKAVKVQAQLTVSNPGDASEQEADRVADVISKTIMSQAQRQEIPEEEEIQTKSTLNRQAAPEEEEEIQTKSSLERQALPEEEEIQADSIGTEGGPVSQLLEARIHRAQGGGQTFPDTARVPMENAFGTDFSGVRIHTDSEADNLNRELSARAFTTGQDIFFREGEYKPGSENGQRLIAHELTHVVQQTGTSGLRRNLESIVRSGQIQMQEEESESAVEPTEGDLPDYQPEEEEEMVKGPDTHRKSVPRPVNVTNDSPAEKLEIKPNINFSFNGAETASAQVGSKNSHRKINLNITSPGGAAVDPYGAENFLPSYKNLKWKKIGNRLNVDVTLDIKCSWGVNGGGNIDVKSANDAVVTAEKKYFFSDPVYKKIAKDLTPVKKEKCWVEPSEKYWSKAMAERHEQYHASDDKKWMQGPGLQVVKSYLEGTKMNVKDAPSKLGTVMDNAIKKLENANWDFYTGGASSYYSYAGEIRAYGDCKDSLMKLSGDILKQGQKLEKADSEKKKKVTKK